MTFELVVLASSVMLAVAQLQIPQHTQTSSFVQPGEISRLPLSYDQMMQSANRILNQDISVPLTPGILNGGPVLINEATRNILNQEARIIGYSPPPNLYVVEQNPQLLNAASLVPFSGHFTGQPGGFPQSLTIPVLTNVHQRPINSVPVASFSKYLKPHHILKHTVENIHKNVYYDIPPNHPVPPQGPQPIQIEDQPSTVDKNVYYDIPPNHPVPAAASNPIQKEDPLNTPPTEVPFQPPASSQDVDKNLIDSQLSVAGQHTGAIDDSVDFMRPPPPPQDESLQDRPFQLSGNSEDPRGRANPYFTLPSQLHAESQNQANFRETDGSKPYKKTSSIKQFLSQLQPARDDKKPRQADSSSQSSEDSYQHTVAGSLHSFSNPHHSYNNNRDSGLALNSEPGSGGYSYSGQSESLVHKHIFVHAAPETYDQTPRIKVIQPQVPQEKHVQIIFVKSPSPPPSSQTIVELPPQHMSKTLVYILSKKPSEGSDNIKIVGPPPSKPLPPEIFFLRYADNKQNQGYPVPNLQSLYDNNQSFGQSLGSTYNNLLRSKRNKNDLVMYAPLMSYATSGQINEITQEEAEFRQNNLEQYF